MKWKPFMWFCIAFLAFVVITAPAWWRTVQQNIELRNDVQAQQDTIGDLQQRLEDSDRRLHAELERRAESVRVPLETELSALQAEVTRLESQLATWTNQRSFERNMQAKLNAASSRIATLEREALKAADEQLVELRTRLAVLQTRHEQTEARLDQLKASDPSEWAELKDVVSDSWQQLSALLQSGSGYEKMPQLTRAK